MMIGQYPDSTELAKASELPFDFLPGAEWMLFMFEATGYGSGEIKDGVLTLHTGGWSGCEDLISAAAGSVWWFRWWHSTTRGGHYVFGDIG